MQINLIAKCLPEQNVGIDNHWFFFLSEAENAIIAGLLFVFATQNMEYFCQELTIFYACNMAFKKKKRFLMKSQIHGYNYHMIQRAIFILAKIYLNSYI